MGTLNFGGFRLNVICVDETYVDDSGAEQRYFPATSAMVTAPDCGHMMNMEQPQRFNATVLSFLSKHSKQ